MPSRYLRASYLESETVNAVSRDAELCWTHLLVVVDDFGRCEANLRVLRAKLFPLRLDSVREADLSRWLAECEKAGLIRRYEVAGKQYLQMGKWEKGRASESKHPQPPTHEDRRTQVLAPAPDSDSDDDNENDTPLPPRGFEDFWKAYPKRKGRGAAERAWRKIAKPIETLPLLLKAIEQQKASADWIKENGQFIPHPATWLNQRRWEDETFVPNGHSNDPIYGP